MDFFLFSSFCLHFIAFSLRPSGLGSDGFFLFCFLSSSVFLNFIAFGLRPSGLGSDGFFLFFDFQRLFAFYCLWFNALGLRLRSICFGFLTTSVLLHFIAFGLMPSGLGSDFFCFCFLTTSVFAFYWLWLKALGFRLRWIFFFF